MKYMIQDTTSVLGVLKSDDTEIQLAAILVLGNLARTGTSEGIRGEGRGGELISFFSCILLLYRGECDKAD